MSLFETLQQRRARVLFLSHSNACRTQMAEAFARALGEDSMLPSSAAASPDAAAGRIGEAVRTVMRERGVPLPSDPRPHPLSGCDLSGFDVVVNLGVPGLPQTSAVILEPLIPSPLAGDLDSHRAVRDRIEEFVRFLAEHFRRAREWAPQLPREATGALSSQTTPPPPPAPGPLQGAARSAAS